MRLPLRRVVSSLVGVATPLTAAAQATVTLRGVVRSGSDAPVVAANVFVLETLDGALTDSLGGFLIRTAAAGDVTLVVRRIGFREARRVVAAGERGSIVITIEPQSNTLAVTVVQAGQYTAGDERGATLTSLEVVTTPGTAADVDRAIQTLPGVQSVDEGTGIFVRGGDYNETKILLNGATMFSPYHLEDPTGTFIGTVNPFLLDGIFFSSGGFGARYGDALSAIVSLTTMGRPTTSTATLGAGLGALSAAGALALPDGFGLRAAGNVFDVGPIMRVNGSTRRYSPAPGGHDLSGSAAWNYRPSGELKLFAITQTNRFGIGVDDPSYSGTYSADGQSDLAVVTWKDAIATTAPSLSLSTSRLRRNEDFGAFRLRTTYDAQQFSGVLPWMPNESWTLRTGGEVERLAAAFDGSIPATGYDAAPGARTIVSRSSETGVRAALFAESDWHVSERARLTTGVRSDRSTLARERTIDPRLSFAFALAPATILTAAWGIYHQVPDPLFYDPGFGLPGLGPMRATQLIVGAQTGERGAIARVELYQKRYRDLAQLSRDNVVSPGGTGTSHGADLFLKSGFPLGFAARLTYSYVASDRTDPSSGVVAHAPFDVTHSLTAIVERRWSGHVTSAIAWRSATGKPFTPVAGATLDTTRGIWVPRYAAPFSERLPGFARLDLSVSYLAVLGGNLQSVFYLSLSNALDRANVYGVRYSPDYSQRFPIPSLFNRSVYFGASVTRF